MNKCFFCGCLNPDNDEFCNSCGKELGHNSERANYTINEETKVHYDDTTKTGKRYGICCPRCRAERLQATVETSTSVKTKGKNYSASKGVLGWLSTV